MATDESAGDERAGLDQAWARTLPARAAREALTCGVFDPIIQLYARRRVIGVEHLSQVDGPMILVANHSSHLDTPVLLRSLSTDRRRRTVIAAAADYFYSRRLLAAAVSLAFSTVPFDRGGRGGGTETLARLLGSGWNIVVFPEGTRSRDGRVGVLRPGAAALAAAHEVPIVPVHIAGTRTVMPAGRGWMVRTRTRASGPFARHTIQVSFGPPIPVAPEDDRFEVMDSVRQFMSRHGAETTPDPKLARRAAAKRGAEGAPEIEEGAG